MAFGRRDPQGVQCFGADRIKWQLQKQQVWGLSIRRALPQSVRETGAEGSKEQQDRPAEDRQGRQQLHNG